MVQGFCLKLRDRGSLRIQGRRPEGCSVEILRREATLFDISHGGCVFSFRAGSADFHFGQIDRIVVG